MNLTNKSILVTGGSRGIGLGLVEALVARGADVTVVARPSEALEAVKRRLGVATRPADVTDQAAAQQIVGEIRPDILVLNAAPPCGNFSASMPVMAMSVWSPDGWTTAR